MRWISDKQAIIVKPRDGTCGKGIEKILPSQHKPADLYRYLVQNRLSLRDGDEAPILMTSEAFRHFIGGSFSFVSVAHTCRGLIPDFSP
jgi:hypothetical protein